MHLVSPPLSPKSLRERGNKKAPGCGVHENMVRKRMYMHNKGRSKLCNHMTEAYGLTYKDAGGHERLHVLKPQQAVKQFGPGLLFLW